MTNSNSKWYFDKDGQPFEADLKNNKILGRGKFGKVFRSRVTTTEGSGEVCAVKHVALDRNKITREHCDIEVGIMKLCKNKPNLVQYIGSAYNEFLKKPIYAIAMELALCHLVEIVSDTITGQDGLSFERVIDFINDCTSALRTLHVEKIAHRDIKPENILVFYSSSCSRRSDILFKLSDFGHSKLLNRSRSKMYSIAGTPNFMHPDIAFNYCHGRKEQKSYTMEKCDLWSLACCLYYCASNRYAFDFPDGREGIWDYWQCTNEMMTNEEHQDTIGVISTVDASLVYDDEHQDTIGVISTGESYEYVRNFLSEENPKWFSHCMTRILISLFHAQNFAELETISRALNEAKESIFLVLDVPANIKIYNYAADLRKTQLSEKNFPKLHEELEIADLSNQEYFCFSKCSIENFTNEFEPRPGETYIVLRRYDYRRTLENEIELPAWQIDLSETDTETGSGTCDSYEIRRTKIKAVHRALTDGDNLNKLYIGMVRVLEEILKELGSRLSKEVFEKLRYNHSNRHDNLEALSTVTEIYNNPEQYISNPTNILDRVKNCERTLKTFQFDQHEINLDKDELNFLLVDPDMQPIAYKDTEELCSQLLQTCLNRKQKITEQLQTLLNKKNGLYWMALEMRELYYDVEACISNFYSFAPI